MRLAGEKFSKSGEVLLSHNHIALLHGLMDRPDAIARVDESIQSIMREHSYVDHKILKIDSARLIKNEDTYIVRFYRTKQPPQP